MVKDTSKLPNEETPMDKKWGSVCNKCGIRHYVFSTPGYNLPKTGRNKCNGVKNSN